MVMYICLFVCFPCHFADDFLYGHGSEKGCEWTHTIGAFQYGNLETKSVTTDLSPTGDLLVSTFACSLSSCVFMDLLRLLPTFD